MPIIPEILFFFQYIKILYLGNFLPFFFLHQKLSANFRHFFFLCKNLCPKFGEVKYTKMPEYLMLQISSKSQTEVRKFQYTALGFPASLKNIYSDSNTGNIGQIATKMSAMQVRQATCVKRSFITPAIAAKGQDGTVHFLNGGEEQHSHVFRSSQSGLQILRHLFNINPKHTFLVHFTCSQFYN